VSSVDDFSLLEPGADVSSDIGHRAARQLGMGPVAVAELGEHPRERREEVHEPRRSHYADQQHRSVAMRGAYRRTVAAGTHGSVTRTRPGRAGREPDGRVRARFRDGDPEAVRLVYRAYGSLVYRVAFRVLGDRSLSEEATQQTFLRAWRAAGRFDASRELGPWLATIARRVAIDLYRREAIRTARPLESVAADDPALVGEAATDGVLDVCAVRRAVSALPAEQQEVVRLQHFDGLAHEEIAAHLKVPVGTVKSRSHRAHRRLALELGYLRDGNPSPGRGRSRSQDAQRG